MSLKKFAVLQSIQYITTIIVSWVWTFLSPCFWPFFSLSLSFRHLQVAFHFYIYVNFIYLSFSCHHNNNNNNNQYHSPNDSKWPVYPLNGGHLTFEGSLSHPKRFTLNHLALFWGETTTISTPLNLLRFGLQGWLVDCLSYCSPTTWRLWL